VPLRRLLRTADRFNDDAMRRALVDLKMPGCVSSALLWRATSADHLRLRRGSRVFDGL
jgi:hypothetical protein